MRHDAQMDEKPEWLDESVPDWLADFAEVLGVDPPTYQEIDELLKLAGVAAHASRRQAAPVATWLVAKSGMSITDAHAFARQVDSHA